MRTLTVLCAAIGLLVAAPSALAATAGSKSETATSGSVTATLTYTMKSDYEASDVRVSITRDGVPATLEGGPDPAAGCKECENAIPIGGIRVDGDGTGSLTLADLDGNGEIEVIVDTYTGGAHCCSISAIYGWDPATNQYRHHVQYWGDPGYVLKDLGGQPGSELLSGDDRFAYAFCAYACSALPVLVYRYENGDLVDVTKQFPLQMRQQDRALSKSIKQVERHPGQRFAIRGLYPAVCANLYRLGHGDSCRRQLRSALKRGWLAPGGEKYVRDVLRTLAKYGYAA